MNYAFLLWLTEKKDITTTLSELPIWSWILFAIVVLTIILFALMLWKKKHPGESISLNWKGWLMVAMIVLLGAGYVWYKKPAKGNNISSGTSLPTKTNEDGQIVVEIKLDPRTWSVVATPQMCENVYYYALPNNAGVRMRSVATGREYSLDQNLSTSMDWLKGFQFQGPKNKTAYFVREKIKKSS